MQFTSDQLVDALVELEPKLKGHYGHRLASISRRLDADDLFQSVAIQAHEDLGNCRADDEAGLRRWIVAIASNTYRSALEYHRNSKRRGVGREEVSITELSTECAYEMPSDNDTADEMLSQHEQQQWAELLIDRCTPAQQQAIRMRYLDESDYSEIARKLGVTETAARLLVSRGLKAARSEREQALLF